MGKWTKLTIPMPSRSESWRRLCDNHLRVGPNGCPEYVVSAVDALVDEFRSHDATMHHHLGDAATVFYEQHVHVPLENADMFVIAPGPDWVHAPLGAHAASAGGSKLFGASRKRIDARRNFHERVD